MIISICFSLSVCLNTTNTAFNWQISLIDKPENIINAKNYMLFLTVLSISIGSIKKIEILNTSYAFNPVIVFSGFALLIYALIFGFDRGSIGAYSSNTNALYEYAIVLFVFIWNYSNGKKYIKILLLIYALIYCLQGILFGDRSSAFPMILLIFMLLYKKQYNMKHIILIGLLGIFFANIIDIFRKTGEIFSLQILTEVLERGLFVNTISYSFYGGTQIVRYGAEYGTHIITHFFSYFASFILGNSNQYNLTSLANSYGFINKGGGMSHIYFYYWFGFVGTILGAFLVGKIINYVFNREKKYCNILKITITIFLIRWFIYYPVALFRTAIIVPLFCYSIFEIFNALIIKKRKVILKKGGKKHYL